ncbi:unnamed protein product [Rotaria magnacalcarata]|uniref:HPP transmembrane region domain-containing protein n=3 Tax=Rotaria magnacalcarata TaxID=392030 RepID=A0A816UES6_9BILA|nr:unnamed protein product [Rotaria magnacalcarata]CAF1571774.1 unnamed protein product [Rotaria magnacalcarata]CAF1989729.1 unnamed protein product [Rotaria magnacalcarata]CAF2068428.1 unnamed protein product [Rotaria magnacalcarata]CAF2113127.1 unnamed protein product [Rotaria magnacalcarata]
MTTIDSPRSDIFSIDENHEKVAVSIEKSVEIIAKIENVEEKNDASLSIFNRCWKWINTYMNKFRGLHEQRPKRLPWQEYLWSFIGTFVSIATIAFFHFKLLAQHQQSFLIGSFGASAVIVFGTPHAPSAQPRNLICGHLIGALCGCIVRVTIYQYEKSIGCAIAVATSIVLMQFTETGHPPGGATALIAVTSEHILPWANFQLILMPALSGAFTMLLVALIVNNMAHKRTYPIFWW